MNLQRSSTRSMQLASLALATVAVLGLIWGWSRVGNTMCMRVQASSLNQIVHLKSNETAKAVIQISKAENGQIQGRLLDKHDETHYSRSASAVAARWDAETKLVMGKSNDLRPGAIVSLSGRLAPDQSILASQIVVLTEYVQVK